ncbi:hypothetical protein NPIL_436981 [Nephila pilipes]|uniref:Uncharacterized protein n=1 Tax=Nephila pilipes TaxID=299642 RepID=A0A8X6R2N1_NEPPI|nr:hypothetical protein NPIL_436981 [Nephila pilipes]
MQPASLNILMPARQPTTISEVLDKDRRLRAMTPWHHNEGELSLPLYIRPSSPPTTKETPPLGFHNASCTPFTGEAPLRASFLLSRTKRSGPFIFKYITWAHVGC